MSTWNVPAGIQCQSVTATLASLPPPSTLITTVIAASHDSTTAPTGIHEAFRPSLRPIVAVTMKPASGSAMIAIVSACSVVTTTASSAHRVVLVDERRLAVAEDGDDDRQPDRRLSGRDRHDHQRDHGAVALEVGH